MFLERDGRAARRHPDSFRNPRRIQKANLARTSSSGFVSYLVSAEGEGAGLRWGLREPVMVALTPSGYISARSPRPGGAVPYKTMDLFEAHHALVRGSHDGMR